MLTRVRPLGLLVVLAFAAAGCLPPDDKQGAKDKADVKPAAKPAGDSASPGTAKPATHKVEKGPFKVEVTLKGVFEAADTEEVALSPEAWSPNSGGMLILRKAAEHGTRVQKGDPILWVDLEKLDQAIADLEKDRHMTELSIKQAEDELPLIEKVTPLDLASAERSKKLADEDLKKFRDEDRALMEKMAHYQVKSSANYLDYAKEELKQLEKMYRSKDLTEETEEIILKRQRNYVEQAEFYLKMAETDRDEVLKYLLPRREQMLVENGVKLALALERIRATAPLALSQKRLALDKMKYERDKATDRLGKLKRDRDALTVKAPADGVVYHGKCVRGQWQAGMPLARGAMLQQDQVLLTVVKTRPVFVRAVVEEKDLHHLRPSLRGKAEADAFPDKKLSAFVESLSAVPVSAGKFEARVAVEAKDADALVPGMACSVKLVAYRNADALAVPLTAVQTDDLDDEKQYVNVHGKDGKPEKRYVTLGKKSGDKVEVVKGLKEGDEVLVGKPDDKKVNTAKKEAGE